MQDLINEFNAPKNIKKRPTHHLCCRRHQDMIDMIQLGIIKAGLVKIIYCGKVVGTGLVNTDGTFSNGSNVFKSPSGFALYMIQQLNPKIRSINGYICFSLSLFLSLRFSL